MNTTFVSRFLSFGGTCLLSTLIAPWAGALDLDQDGLSDIWQQNYGAEDLLPEDDTDGDGQSNLAESQAGTDPFDAQDFLHFNSFQVGAAQKDLFFSFPTKAGKNYQISAAEDLLIFQPIGLPLAGNESNQALTWQLNEPSLLSGSIQHQYWANITESDLESFTSQLSFPDNPDGNASLKAFEVPSLRGTGFGGRLRALITPPESGDFNIFISTSSSARVYLSTDEDPLNQVEVCSILSGQTGVNENEWFTFASQRSESIPLVSGKRYHLEVHYLALNPNSHCQVAWSGAGLDGIEVLSHEHVAPTIYLPQSIPEQNLRLHDYDSAEQTETLWPENTTLVPALAGMSGTAERVDDDPGNATAESVLFTPTTDHLYVTWLFNIASTEGDPLLGHDDVNLFFQGATSDEEGPRVNLEERNSFTSLAVRAGNNGGNQVQLDIEPDTTYRVELLASLDTDFIYQDDLTTRTVSPDTFDLYLSDADGNLIGRALGLNFREEVPHAVTTIDRMRAVAITQPRITFDSWEFTAGNIAGNGYLPSNVPPATISQTDRFFQLIVSDSDQDSDGLTDWEENLLGRHHNFLFFDPETINGTADESAATILLNTSTGSTTVSLAASDTAAFEDNSPNLNPDHGEILVTRTGPLSPLTVNLCIAPLEHTGNTSTVCNGTCCTLIGSAGDEAAEVNDYILEDEDGNILTNTLSFGFGEMSKTITVIANPDQINEYPETLNLALAPSLNNSYELSSSQNGASIQLFDLPDNPANNAIFTGTFSQDGNAVVATQASGFTTAILNGPRTKLYLSNEFTSSSPTFVQQDSHVHKSNLGPSPGTIIYAITNEPGGESLPAPASDPFIGFLDNYEWDLTESSGAVPTAGGAASRQVIIDSLFGQNGESPLYLNIHTVDNPAGEIWAFLNLTGGSATDPGAPNPAALAGSTEYPQLFGDDLESEVRRFLNQATFGAFDEDVLALINTIESARITNPDYHRAEAYQDWIHSQIDLVPQSYLLDYNLAADFQQLTLRGVFDPNINPSNELYQTPAEPTTWPTVNRSSDNPDHWYLEHPYPIVRDDLRLTSDNGISGLPGNTGRRQAHWQMMYNARDQLRQKMGFALQQIVVVSAQDNTIRSSPYASSNYQDQLNIRAFDHYRDILGYVNWSPLMGRWLSSLGNQKGIDLDGDGIDDVSPDENLARENMQLFSIGLFEIWPDGTLRLGPDGAPNNTYNNEDIREFARVLTGLSFSINTDQDEGWGGVPFSEMTPNTDFDTSQGSDGVILSKYSYPMKMFGEYHDLSVKTFAGVTIDNTHLSDPTEQGIADIEDALDWLAGKPGDGQPDFDMENSHGSTPAFICLRLIQRFTTSNPSRDYLHRVATAFQESEGSLRATINAILLDPEARILDPEGGTFGYKKSPLESYLQLARTLEAYSHIPIFDPNGAYPFDSVQGSLANPHLYLTTFDYPAEQVANQQRNIRFLQGGTITAGTTGLQMEPFFQETVFNWYLPDHAPGGPIADAGLVAPELQLANEPDLIRNINFQNSILRSSSGYSVNTLGGSTSIQQAVFETELADVNENIRLDRALLANRFYPAIEPTDLPDGRTAESVADEALVDAIDKRLTYGFFKQKYPYDASDDDNPDTPEIDDDLKNPRELIIDAISGYGNPYNGNSDDNDRQLKLIDALYLLSFSPEFQINK